MIVFKRNKYFMIDEKLLDKDESKEFISCLELEKLRHEVSKLECLRKIELSSSLLFLTFWFSSFKRHIQDIEMIDKSINYLKSKWGLNKNEH